MEFAVDIVGSMSTAFCNNNCTNSLTCEFGATSDTLLDLQTVFGNRYEGDRKILYCLDNFMKNVK
jgi:hypothetical protein